MAPVAFSLATRLGINSRNAFLLALALLLTPATGYVALHEFHPEALTAPFLLLMLQARAARCLAGHWLWFAAVLACKENMALTLAAYCAVNLVLEHRGPIRELWGWYGWPLVASVGWFVLCTKVITPVLNAGEIDYLALYSHLGDSAADIVMNVARSPARILLMLWHAAVSGNLAWAVLLPFLALPILRLRWLLIASPMLLQHLLSWRYSEWTIYFHYAAPALPLLWIGMVETIARLPSRANWIPVALRNTTPVAVVLACIAAQAWLGPAAAMATTAGRWSAMKQERDRKNAFISVIPANAKVIAPLPYLSHLAAREKLYSLHYILKGLKTLSRVTYEPPPPPDFVLVDYADTATFDSSAGYYHPAMRTADGRVIPSSERLLHELLRQISWTATSVDELTLLRQTPSPPALADRAQEGEAIANLGPQTRLLAITKNREQLTAGAPLEIQLRWRFEGEREVFPWMTLVLAPASGGVPVMIVKGLCAPEAAGGTHEESWKVTTPAHLLPGEYSLAALFHENPRPALPPGAVASSGRLLSAAVPLGRLMIASSHDSPP